MEMLLDYRSTDNSYNLIATGGHAILFSPLSFSFHRNHCLGKSQFRHSYHFYPSLIT